MEIRPSFGGNTALIECKENFAFFEIAHLLTVVVGVTLFEAGTRVSVLRPSVIGHPKIDDQRAQHNLNGRLCRGRIIRSLGDFLPYIFLFFWERA